MGEYTVGSATSDDLGGIATIYHHYVLTTAHTFELEAKPVSWWRDWFSGFEEHGRHRLVVARSREGPLGYALSDAYRPRPAYDPSVLMSVYVAKDHVGAGIGTALYLGLFEALAGVDIHRAYAAIAMPNPASIRLHERFGFVRAGYFSEQGRKFGRYWDVAWYEKSL